MKKLIILLTLALSFSFVNAEKYQGLKVKYYKNIQFLVEDLVKSNSEIKVADIETELKLTLFKYGIKGNEEKGESDYLYIDLDLMPLRGRTEDAYFITISYCKYASNHKVDVKETGFLFTPYQGQYQTIGIAQNKNDIIDGLETALKKFIVDYIESNTE
jgi:hypothetical protein